MGLVGEQAEGWKEEWPGEEGGLADGERVNWVKNEAEAEMKRNEEAFWSSFHKTLQLLPAPQPGSEYASDLPRQRLSHISLVASYIMSSQPTLLGQ